MKQFLLTTGLVSAVAGLKLHRAQRTLETAAQASSSKATDGIAKVVTLLQKMDAYTNFSNPTLNRLHFLEAVDHFIFLNFKT